ncbi:hypothetical protein D3C71_2245020 [compost metagenome]
MAYRAWLTTSGALEPTKNVLPSGLARATWSAAIMPAAPGLFSMMMGGPPALLISWATNRVI